MKKILNIAIALFSLLMMYSCGEPDYPEAVPSVATQTSRLLVVHTYAGAPQYSIKVDNRVSEKDTVRFEKAADGKYYDNVTLAVPAGPNRLVTVTDANNTRLVTDRFTAAANMNNTSFITFASANNEVVPAIVRVSDDLTLPDPGFAKVRFFNFSPDAGEVQVTEEGGTTTIFSLRKFKETSRRVGSTTTEFNRFTNISIPTYPSSTSTIVTYEVRSATGDVLLTIEDMKLDSKGIYTIYLKGSVIGSGDLALNYGIIKH